jgi:hypothetical protein
VTPIDEELWFESEGNDEETEAKAAESMAAMVGRTLGATPFRSPRSALPSSRVPRMPEAPAAKSEPAPPSRRRSRPRRTLLRHS